VQHQWQRQVGQVRDELRPGIGAGWSAAELAGVVDVVALLVVTILHGWAAEVGAGCAATAGIEGGMVSTASKAGTGEP